MSIFDLRDPDDARRYLLEGLLFSAAAPITESNVRATLLWAMEIVSEGSPLPCLGLVTDIGLIATNQNVASPKNEFDDEIARDPTMLRQYEDYVLGKLFSDFSFERASDALSRYRHLDESADEDAPNEEMIGKPEERDHRRAVAYIINQIRDRSNAGGAILSLAVIKSLLELPPEEVIEQAVNLVNESGWSEFLQKDFSETIIKIRNTGELLGREDVFELEQGTALAEFGQRVALRQVLRASAEFEDALPSQRPNVPARKYSVATNILEEDFYPIGGFTSISNKGTIESLLRSELAYLDEDTSQRPDLFDIKYVRDELLYYSRDENQFLRRRLAFLFFLDPTLVTTRFKDAELPVQRVVLWMAFLVATVRKLLEWLSDDAIKFEIVFIESVGQKGLAEERTLFETLFREEIESELLVIRSIEREDIGGYCDEKARESMCHAVMMTADPKLAEARNHQTIESKPKKRKKADEKTAGEEVATIAAPSKRKISLGEFAIPSWMIFDEAIPSLIREDDEKWQADDEGMDGWIESVRAMARHLV